MVAPEEKIPDILGDVPAAGTLVLPDSIISRLHVLLSHFFCVSSTTA